MSACAPWPAQTRRQRPASDRGRTRRGFVGPGACVPSELPVKALVGSRQHHENGLSSNAVEGTDQQPSPSPSKTVSCAFQGVPRAHPAAERASVNPSRLPRLRP